MLARPDEGQHACGDRVDRERGGLHNEIGGPVERGPFVEQPPHAPLGVGAQQGAVSAAPHPGEDGLRVGEERDDQAVLPEAVHVLVAEDDAAPGGDDAPAPGGRRRDRLRFEPPERRLAVLGEDAGDRPAGQSLDQRVGVQERAAQPGRDHLPHRGLARAHEADEHDVGLHGPP